MLNLSDLKPALLTAAAALAFVYDPRPYLVNSSGEGHIPNRTAAQAQAIFLTKWVAQQYTGTDPSTLSRIAELWTQYFELSWIQRGSSDEMLGGYIGNIATRLASDLGRDAGNISTKTIQYASDAARIAQSGLSQAEQLHEAATALASDVPNTRIQFFRSHLLLQSAIQRFGVVTIAHLSNATFALVNHTGPEAKQVAQTEIKGALEALDALFAAERAAEGSGEWRGLYWADRHRFTNFQARRREVLRLQAALAQQTYSPASQIDCCQMEYAYQWTPKHLASYPLIYDSATYRASDFVLISCVNATSDGGRCNNGVDGGVFWGSASVTLALTPTANAGDTIMYTLDGSDPLSGSGKQFTSPIVLRETTQVSE